MTALWTCITRGENWVHAPTDASVGGRATQGLARSHGAPFSEAQLSGAQDVLTAIAEELGVGSAPLRQEPTVPALALQAG